MRKVLEAHLARVDYEAHVPVRLRPFVFADTVAAESLITIDPRVAFGRPIFLSQGVSTETVAARIESGEDAASVAADYGLSKTEVEQAVVCERAA
jgi:uncharacterized protein (DUF433 family)